MEGEWLCYGGGQFNGGRMVMLQVVTLMEGKWSCYRGGLMERVVTEVARLRDNGHVTEVITLKKG